MKIQKFHILSKQSQESKASSVSFDKHLKNMCMLYMTVKIMLAGPQRKGRDDGVVTRMVSIRHLCCCLSHALYSADLMAMGSCCLILTGRHSQSLVRDENQPLAERADPYLCSWGPSTPIKRRKLCFLRILSMVCSFAKSCDAGRTSPGPPTPAQEGAHTLFALGFRTRRVLVSSKNSSSSKSIQMKGLLLWGPQAKGTSQSDMPVPAGALIPAIRGGSSCGEELRPLFPTFYSLTHMHLCYHLQREGSQVLQT